MTRHEHEVIAWITAAVILASLLACDVPRRVDAPPATPTEVAVLAVHNIHAFAHVRCQCCHGAVGGCPTGKDPRRCSGCHG